MGGFMAYQAGARDAAVTAIITISAADLGAGRLQSTPADKRELAVSGLAAVLEAENMAPLAGTTALSLANEVSANAAQWNFASLAPKLAARPLLILTSDDGWAAANDALAAGLGSQKVKAIHIATDHAYSDHRIALQQAVLDFLAQLRQK
jgi:hypothetical protein